jgi:hypothetical protein
MATRAPVQVASAAADAQESAQEAAEQAIPWVEKLARFGYAAKGVVYIVIGYLALQLAFGQGGEATGPEGALSAIGQQPLGRAMLAIVAAGLFAYALWRLVQAVVDPERKGKDAKGLAQRAGYAVSGLTYGTLGLFAARIAMGQSGGPQGGQSQEDWTARLLAQPFGVWLVGLVGLVVIGIGLYQLYYGISGKFRDELKLHEMSSLEKTWATRAGRLGYIARGIVYTIIGGLFILAALNTNPEEAGGFGDAMAALAQQPYGPWLIGLIGLGVLAYGVYAFVQAKYRRIFAQ